MPVAAAACPAQHGGAVNKNEKRIRPMPLILARALSPLAHRQDWSQDRLTYLPGGMYRPLISVRHFLRRR